MFIQTMSSLQRSRSLRRRRLRTLFDSWLQAPCIIYAWKVRRLSANPTSPVSSALPFDLLVMQFAFNYTH